MDVTDAYGLARRLMDEHGLAGWRLVVDRAKRRAGYTSHERRTISFSRTLLELYQPDQVRALILHEVAHALVGPGHGHDAVWRRLCLDIGGDGRTRVDAHWPSPTPLWVGVCPNGHSIARHRLVRRTSTCRICSPVYDERFLITWTNQRTGEVFRKH